MDTLFKIVDEILNEPSIEISKQKLYGLAGININSVEYYESIVSQFVRKKDLILSKVKKDIIYNLDTDIQDIWDIVFIAQYVYKYWTQEQEELRKELSRLKSIIPRTDEIKNKIAEINNDVALISMYFQKINKESELSKVKIYGLNSSCQINLQNQIKELKKAILVLQRLRDSFEHRNSNLKLDKLIEIHNEKNYFRLVIPSDYIDGFNRGRIIVKNEDKELVNKTNSTIYPLLHELKYDHKKIENFFYNVEPQYLNYLLSLVNNDIKKLYKLPSFIFESRYKKVINAFISENIKLEELANIPMIFDLFYNRPYYINNYIELIVFCKQNNINYAEIKEQEAFIYSNNTIKLLKCGCSVNELNLMSVDTFYDIKNFSNDITHLEKIKKLGVDLANIPIIYSNNKNDLIKLIEYGFTLDKLNEVCNEAHIIKGVHCTFSLPSPQNIEYLKNININVNSLTFNILNNLDYSIELIKKGADIELLKKLSEIAISNYYKAHILIQNGLDIEYVNKLPQSAYDNFGNTLQIVSKLKEKGFDSFPILDDMCYSTFVNIEKLCEFIAFLEKDEIQLLLTSNKINLWEKDVFEKITELKKVLREVNLEFKDIIKKDDDIIIIGTCEKLKRFIDLCKKNNVSIDIIKYIPIRVIAFINNNDIEYKYEKSIFDLFNFFCKRGIAVNKPLPEKLFLSSCDFSGSNPLCNFKYENLCILLNKVDNDYSKLDMFPTEFFQCDSLILSEFIYNYNLNITKSIFGIDNPKVIASLIYMNSVLSKIDINFNFDSIDFDPISFIHETYNDSIRFMETTNSNVFVNQDGYLRQFIMQDKTGQQRDFTNMKSYIISKLRNSAAHFRFKLVKDHSGTIIEDKIYLYDEDNDGTNNFNIIMSVRYLVSVVREVENGLNLINTKEEHPATIKI